uniref:uncharacterized protein LOC122586527 n=1 Tax=Erigeron canadensis TaxID=72917 RepID=UPI001CB9621B|nr:uncharacterized protein LOC122586527 [Erigeron canadensis]
MVLVDEKGAKIQCMVKKDLVPIFDNLIKEDTAVIVKRFGVGVNDDPFPVVKHKLKLSFYKSTEVQHGVTFTGPAYGFSFTPFNEITVTKARDKDTLNIGVQVSNKYLKEVQLGIERSGFILSSDKKQLDEVREAEQPGDVVVVATIAMLEPEFGWFFIACKKCQKKVISKMEYLEIADEEELTDELINAPGDSIWCRKEKKIATEVGPKFRVTMRVQDNTGSASFVMWDRDVQKLLGLSAHDIRQRQLNNDDDETYPHELEGLLNVKVAFKIKIDKYNVKHKGSAYTVNKMCDDPDIIAELEDEENDNEVQQQEAMPEIVSAVKLAEESQGGPDSKDAFSVTSDSLAAEIEKDCETSPLQKRSNDTPGVESTSKSGKRVRKAKIY